LMVATFLTLFVLPVLYIIFEKGFTFKTKKPGSITTAVVLFLACCSIQKVNAQVPITLNAAIDTAFKNNLTVKNEILNTEYQKKLKAAAVNIPQTNINGEYGQINSFYNDNKIGVSQAFSFPTVYTKQKALQNEYLKSSLLNVGLRKAELKRQVSDVFYTLTYLQQKQAILLQTDSVYATFLEKVNLRFKTGESNILEKATTETQRGQIAIQLSQVQQDIEISQLQFQLLLNTLTVFKPAVNNLKMNNPVSLDSALTNNPQLSILQQQKNVASANTNLERSKLLPDITIGYNNQSIQGTGANDVFYPKSSRFSSVELGIGVPIFFGPQRARINASRTLELIGESNYRIGLQTLRFNYQSAIRQYQLQLKNVQYFEETALKNAEIITKTANQQFANGDINFLEWTMLINNAITIRSSYADAVRELN
ncbi:MAG: TolC family protein, partial [Sphingobacteriales bacterium]